MWPVLWVNRTALPLVWRRVLPIVLAFRRRRALGTFILALGSASSLRLITYLVRCLRSLCRRRYRRAVGAERAMGVACGGLLGSLYAATTISGPPLVAVLNNQGLAKHEFPAALGSYGWPSRS